MKTAALVGQALPQFCPVTNHYRCSDGKHLLITLPALDSMGTLSETLGIVVPVAKSHIPTTADVFLADENAVVLDADGDPSNGMTALAKLDGLNTFEEVLAELGYQLDE
ncbi:hypothetical protein SEA_LEOPARD_41 [Mycobacterium phage Leopard]|uniref:DUF7572 domain-containing protein n=1 Tax=Mycobacterium phage Onyinye TaxID=2686235 RepID=A0A6B9LD12_9CAUD|nr:minor tail protein [Mycobacterium phage Onyinye]QHB37448.1 hypothetical protein SEA_ONYINYE_42 [Mycobacterium phage Onyinye]UOW92919.1 hypothetical protein SEA_LEOPARD_41 [Mycobacterium phage Leopard]WKW85203.1 hypothetical protein SEA_AIKOY__41 [Mycobacterium phage Aikoy]